MKKKKLFISLFVIVVVTLFIVLHSTPKLAIRSHVLFMGYPKAAITSEIVEYEYQTIGSNRNDIRGYVFTEPPTEKATEGLLDTYQVKKIGFLYFADFIKDI